MKPFIAEGKLFIPVRFSEEDGSLIGDAFVELAPDDAEYEAWLLDVANKEPVAEYGTAASGNYGHKGVKGVHGGSAPGGGKAAAQKGEG